MTVTFIPVGTPGLIMKGTEGLATPPTVTMTLPLIAPAGTATTIPVADHDVGVAVVPLNVIVLVPLIDPKPLPVIVTTVPTGPLAGDRLVITGPTVTV
jgi:hypothetical protein